MEDSNQFNISSTNQPSVNTSGQGSSASVPKEIKRWNWGAFFLTWIWGLFHHVWLSLLVFIPYAGLVMMIILGIKGSEWAWQAQHYDSIEEFKKRERKWSIAGIIVWSIIPILYIISIIMIRVIINPDEMLKKARDSQRISDLNTLKAAINMYLIDTSNPNLGSPDYYYVSNNIDPHILCANRIAKTTSSQSIDGSGWIPIDFTSISGGSPISSLSVDPNPNLGTGGDRYYIYLTDPQKHTFELIANMESSYYSKGGRGDVESTDGGVFPDLYEVGNNLVLSPSAKECFITR